MSSTALWDLEVYFEGFDSPDYLAALESCKAAVSAYAAAVGVGTLEESLVLASKLSTELNLLLSYTYCAVSVDTRNERGQARLSELDLLRTELRKAETRFAAWVGGMDLDAEFAKSSVAKEHEFLLRKAHKKASHQMSPNEENLAADLDLTGASAWERLYDTVTSQLEVDLNGETLPMSAVRNLAAHPDRAKRKAAYEAELVAWEQVEGTLAACMNGIKGQVNTLANRRGWGESGLPEATFDNSIDAQTLDAMIGAAREAFPDFRRYLKAKAKLIGAEGCEWYDLFAPVGEEKTWSQEEGSEFVATQFDQYSQKMGDFARRSYRERWIDFPPRAGKVGGAYCSGTKDDESRILMNYDGSFGNVKTLAHELGHAYHNLCLSQRSPLLRDTPATLAETASIFCETIVKDAALKTVSGDAKLAILEACLQAPCQTVVDITSRFLFEKSVFADRAKRDLSPRELSERMLEAQRETYGDGLASYHGYMWAAKPHYYSSYSFYNFPYMFGLLFALGLYKRYQADPEAFKGQYDELLASTGQANAYELGQRFGFDTRSSGFWEGSLDVVRKDVDDFVALVESR